MIITNTLLHSLNAVWRRECHRSARQDESLISSHTYRTPLGRSFLRSPWKNHSLIRRQRTMCGKNIGYDAVWQRPVAPASSSAEQPFPRLSRSVWPATPVVSDSRSNDGSLQRFPQGCCVRRHTCLPDTCACDGKSRSFGHFVAGRAVLASGKLSLGRQLAVSSPDYSGSADRRPAFF